MAPPPLPPPRPPPPPSFRRHHRRRPPLAPPPFNTGERGPPPVAPRFGSIPTHLLLPFTHELTFRSSTRRLPPPPPAEPPIFSGVLANRPLRGTYLRQSVDLQTLRLNSFSQAEVAHFNVRPACSTKWRGEGLLHKALFRGVEGSLEAGETKPAPVQDPRRGRPATGIKEKPGVPVSDKAA